MTLHVLGGGSIGLLYASSMRLAGRKKFPICLLLQPHHENKMRPYNEAKGSMMVGKKANGSSCQKPFTFLRKDGILHDRFVSVEMKDFYGNVHRQDISAELIGSEEDSQQNIRNILLVTKAPQAVPAMEKIIPRFHATDKINLVIMTNGSLSVFEGVQNSLKEKGIDDRVEIIYASSTHGAIRGEDIQYQDKFAFSVTWTGIGQTFIQNNADKEDCLQQKLHETWNEVGLNSSLLSRAEMYVLNWKKLATNCAINPLTALKNCRNGDLLADQIDRPSYENTFNYSGLSYDNPAIFYQLIREVSDVARAEAEKCTDTMMDITSIKNELSYDKLSHFVENVVHQTSRNKSSMLQDVLLKRHPTEISHLNGFVSKLGAEYHNIKVRANSYLSREVERLTK